MLNSTDCRSENGRSVTAFESLKTWKIRDVTGQESQKKFIEKIVGQESQDKSGKTPAKSVNFSILTYIYY